MIGAETSSPDGWSKNGDVGKDRGARDPKPTYGQPLTTIVRYIGAAIAFKPVTLTTGGSRRRAEAIRYKLRKHVAGRELT
jgi:hypothetical protein